MPIWPISRRQQRADRLPVVVDVELDRLVELLVGEAFGQSHHLAGQPDVVLDHLRQQVHGGHLVSCRQPEAAGWVEVDAARRGDLDVPGLACARRPAATPYAWVNARVNASCEP